MTKSSAKRKRRAHNPISAIKRRPHEDMRNVVIDYRCRQYGLTPEQARHERASTALGRAFLTGDIDDTLYRAGDEYKRLQDTYFRAQNVPDGFAVSDCGDGGGGENSPEYDDWVKRTKERWYEVHGALWAKSAWNAVVTESLVLKDATQLPSHIGYAKQGLKFLSTKLGIST